VLYPLRPKGHHSQRRKLLPSKQKRMGSQILSEKGEKIQTGGPAECRKKLKTDGGTWNRGAIKTPPVERPKYKIPNPDLKIKGKKRLPEEAEGRRWENPRFKDTY